MKDSGVKAASERAEENVADQLGISSAMVRKLHGTVQRECNGIPPDDPTLPLSTFRTWQNTGSFA